MVSNKDLGRFVANMGEGATMHSWAPKGLNVLRGAISGLGGASVGWGSGALARARFEEKLKDDKDLTIKDKALSNAPLILGALGAVAGASPSALRYSRLNRAMKDIRKGAENLGDKEFENIGRTVKETPFMDSVISKFAALKKEVELKPHQVDAIGRLIKNDGSLLAAHATGTGKTLTGIAGFEQLKKDGKAKKAIVVVPASLRNNFVDNLKKFTDSSYSMYGPRGEKKTKNIDDKSNSDYNIISYDLFREHGDEILKNTGADTVILDEVHRVRGTEGSTYNKLRDLRGKVKNAITLTGSVVNNEPNEVVPLLDITYGPEGHKLISKKFFDKLFVQKDAKTRGIFKPKTYVEKRIKNSKALGSYLGNKLDYIGHSELEKLLPRKTESTVEVEMTPHQQKLYDFGMGEVDALTRWKIKNNLPVTQREAKDAFSKLMKARQVSTDPSVLDKNLEGKDPYEYSPKVRAVVDDLVSHLDEEKGNKSLIYGNLLQGQVNAVEDALKRRGIQYSKFVGIGNKGSSAKQRGESLQDFIKGKNRVLLASGAGAEGLDLKGTTMMQMLEGHYNPERIQQAEARVRRMEGSEDEAQKKHVTIKRYVSRPAPPQGVLGRVLHKAYSSVGMGGGGTGVDQWIYNIAKKKDDLNTSFRDALTKTAGYEDTIEAARIGFIGNAVGMDIGKAVATPFTKALQRRRDSEMESAIKQRLLDRNLEELTTKKHYKGILKGTKLDERMIDTSTGMTALLSGAFLLGAGKALTGGVPKGIVPTIGRYTGVPVLKAVAKLPFAKGLRRIANTSDPVKKALIESIAGATVSGLAVGAGSGPLSEYLQTQISKAALRGDDKSFDKGLNKYVDKHRKKIERKYKSSKGFVQEYDTKRSLGIDPAVGGGITSLEGAANDADLKDLV